MIAADSPFDGRPVVVIGGFASYDYDLLWQRQQRVVSLLAQTNPVFYLERLGARKMGLFEIARAVGKRLLFRGRPGGASGGIRFVRSVAVPFAGFALADTLTASMCVAALGSAVGGGLADAVCLCCFPAPYSLAIVQRERFRFVMYDAVQNFAALPSVYGERAGETDRLLARAADFNSTDTLYVQRLRKEDDLECLRIPQGVDRDWVARAMDTETDVSSAIRAQGRGRPIVGFVGGVGEAFDVGLFNEVVRLLPGVTFVLVGPISEGVVLGEAPNLVLIGPVPGNAVAPVMHAFDVGLIPYVRNSHTDAVLPTKLVEYLASGTPVVSSGLPEVLARLDELPLGTVGVADNPQAFALEIADALRRGRVSRVVAEGVARAGSWEHMLGLWLHEADRAYRSAG